jgi:UTP--glucose-1-phosphate uridylyltransferase
VSPQVTKAIIPAAGLGTRFLPATKAQPKEMLPLVDKPAIQYVVEEAVAAGITDILIITGRGKRSIEDHFDRSLELEVMLEQGGKTEALEEIRAIADMADFHYVRQGEQKGLGHAVLMAKKHVGNEPFVVMLGDDVMHANSTVLRDMMSTYDKLGKSVVAFKDVPREDISSYGCADAEVVGDNVVRLKGLVEKPNPNEAPSTLAIMGRYVLTPDIFDAIERTKPGKGGEIQLTDALSLLIAESEVYGWTFNWGRFDIGKKIDFLRATVELALERPDLGDEFRKFLHEILDES